jgi:hypothetical protein
MNADEYEAMAGYQFYWPKPQPHYPVQLMYRLWVEAEQRTVALAFVNALFQLRREEYLITTVMFRVAVVILFALLIILHWGLYQ